MLLCVIATLAVWHSNKKVGSGTLVDSLMSVEECSNYCSDDDAKFFSTAASSNEETTDRCSCSYDRNPTFSDAPDWQSSSTLHQRIAKQSRMLFAKNPN